MSVCWWLQPHAAAARARVEYHGAGGVAGAVGDAAQQVQVHPADEGGELSGEPVEGAVTQDQRAVGIVAVWLVAGVLQRGEEGPGGRAGGPAGLVGGSVEDVLHGSP